MKVKKRCKNELKFYRESTGSSNNGSQKSLNMYVTIDWFNSLIIISKSSKSKDANYTLNTCHAINF